MKKNHIKTKIIGAIAISLSSFSGSEALAALSQGVNSVWNEPQKRSSFFLKDQVHVSKRSALIQVETATDFSGEEMKGLTGQFLDLPEGSIVTLVDESLDGRFVTLSLNIEDLMSQGEDVSGLPNLLKINANELSKMDLSLVELHFDDGVAEFELPEMVAGRRSGRAAMTYCLGDVRAFAGQKKNCGKIPTPAAGKGSRGYSEFKKAGWQPISKEAWKDYPVCTACFYGGGRQDCTRRGDGKGKAIYECGHAAVKTNVNTWKGAGTRTVPGLPDRIGKVRGVWRKPYVFHGCLIHPNSGKS